MEDPTRPIEPALVSVRLAFVGGRAHRRVSSVYAIHVDGRPVGSTPYGVVSAAVLLEGEHALSVVIGPWVSDIVQLDLAGGDHVELVCAMKPLVRNRFFKFFEWKLNWVILPLALASTLYPGVAKFIERHWKFEFLAIVVLGLLGGLLALPRAFSRKPGAMLSLSVQPAPPEDAPAPEGSGLDITFTTLQRLVEQGAWPYFVLPSDIEGLAVEQVAMRDRSPSNLPLPLPIVLGLVGLNTLAVLLGTLSLFPPGSRKWFLLLAPVHGLLIGALFAVQTLVFRWIQARWQAWRAHPSPDSSFR